MKVQTLSREVVKGRQSIDYIEYVKMSGTVSDNVTNTVKLRITMKSDSYDFQSYARIAKFDGVKWQVIHSIPYQTMCTPYKLYYAMKNQPINQTNSQIEDNNVASFEKDRKALINMAELILF